MPDVQNQISDRFTGLYGELLAADVELELFGKSSRVITKPDLAYLLTVASRLSLSSEADSLEEAAHCRYAYEVAVRSPNFANGSSAEVSEISELILSRVGNFPAKRLLIDRSLSAANSRKDAFFEMEELIRERENTFTDGDNSCALTDFQVRLLDSLRAKSYVSVSAPTSAGKSFTLELDLLRRLRKAHQYVAVYLVPTRALIRQVSLDLIELFRDNQVRASVLSTISVPPPQLANPRPQRIVFVLTQERFATLLAEVSKDFLIDAIIVDEAQEIGGEERGITLERVLQIALRRFPAVSLFFSSPLRSNPSYLLELFGKSEVNAASFVEYRTPVTQNIIVVSPQKGKTNQARIDVFSEGKTMLLAEIELPFKFRGRYMGSLALHFTKPTDTSIIYCNGPASADTIAFDISEKLSDGIDADLLEFAAFLQQEVHHLYRLAMLVKKGIAFHYSNIPQIVRGRVEELVKAKKIGFVCCTSTLLQGMNLPAKNIFVENPKTGQGEEGQMSRGDFWNLVGRAGRLTQEFTGNVFCVFGKEWDSNLLAEEKLMPVESAFQTAVRQRTKELAFWSRTPPLSAEGGEAWAELAFANIFANRVENGSKLADSVSNEELAVSVNSIDVVATELSDSKTLPDSVFTSNFYVHPQRLEELAKAFRSAPSVLSLMPANPFSDSAYERTKEIFGIIEEVFIKSGNKRHLYLAVLALRWMRGMPLKDLVATRLEWQKTPNEEKPVNAEIRALFREIEEELRFKYVKYTGLYLKVLDAILREKGFNNQADKIPPLHLFLEFGASSKTLISLMSLGLSRTSAILLKAQVSLADDLDVIKCNEYLESINLDKIQIPSICKIEIRKLRQPGVKGK
jgi:hypothetical protein